MTSYTIREFAEISGLDRKAIEYRLSRLKAKPDGYKGEGGSRARTYSLYILNQVEDYAPRKINIVEKNRSVIPFDLIKAFIPKPLTPTVRWYGFAI